MGPAPFSLVIGKVQGGHYETVTAGELVLRGGAYFAPGAGDIEEVMARFRHAIAQANAGDEFLSQHPAKLEFLHHDDSTFQRGDIPIATEMCRVLAAARPPRDHPSRRLLLRHAPSREPGWNSLDHLWARHDRAGAQAGRAYRAARIPRLHRASHRVHVELVQSGSRDDKRTARRDNDDQREGRVMRKVKMQLVWVAACMLAVGVVAAQAQQPKRGGTLTYTYHPEPTALSTIATTAVPVALVSTKIYESLLEYEGAGARAEARPRGILDCIGRPADLYVQLRGGVKWHDGKPFTSEDVKFSIEKIVRPLPLAAAASISATSRASRRPIRARSCSS